MNLQRFRLLLFLPATIALAEPASPPKAYALETFASLGSNFARDTGLNQLGWTEQQFDAFIDGIRATYRGRGYVFTEDAMKLRGEVEEKLRLAAEKEQLAQLDFSDPKKVQAFMKEAAKQHQLQFSDSGLAFRLALRGSNQRPAPEDTVVLSCESVLPDGHTPVSVLTFKQRRVRVEELIPGLVEIVQMMSPDGSALVLVPPDLSFGTGPWPDGLPRGTPVVCILQLHEIIAAP
jgi:FKBP-type peptidyl-prolyl cis-trans isomerase